MYATLHKAAKAHDDSLWSVAWTAETNKIVTSSVDASVRVWNGETFAAEHQFKGGHLLGVHSVDVSADGALAVSASLDSQICLWDLQAKALLRTIDPGPAEAWKACFSPKGNVLATGSHSGAINLWTVADGSKAASLETKGGFALAVAFSPNGETVACGTEKGAVYVFDVESKKQINKFEGMCVSSCCAGP